MQLHRSMQSKKGFIMKGFIEKFFAWRAKRWLTKSYNVEKKTFIQTGSFMVRAERRRVLDPALGEDVTRLQRTFTIHRHFPPETISAGDTWWYEKYELTGQGEYKAIGHGKYPGNWAKKK